MPLILAVEPDPRRAAQLTAMARAHLDAELLLAPSAAEAFRSLGDRIPDLLLLTPLLAPAEEAAVDDYLRLIGPAGAHVQSLSIPRLSTPTRTEPMPVSGRRRPQTTTADDGCDPARFAEQVAHYLREASGRVRVTPLEPTEAELRPEDDLSTDLTAALDEPSVESATMPSAVAMVDEPELDDEILVPEVIDLADEILDFEPIAGPAAIVPFAASAPPESRPDPILSEAMAPFASMEPLAPVEPLASVEPFASVEPVASVEPPAPVESIAAYEPMAVADLLLEPRLDPSPLAAQSQPTPAAVPDAQTMGLTRQSPRSRRPTAPAEGLMPVVVQPPLAAPEHTFVPMPAPQVLPAPQVPTVQQLIAVPSGNGTHVQAAVNVAVAVSVQVAAAVSVSAPPPKRRKPKPVQDEWGLFDPGQCGFQALIARLDEIAAKEDEEDDA